MLHHLFFITSLLLLLIHVLGVVYAAHAVLTVRTAQGAIAWIMGLLIFPYITLPLYLVFGSKRFHGYAEAHRKIYAEFRDNISNIYSQLEPFQYQYFEKFLPIQNLARDIQGVGFLSGNYSQLLINGQEIFDAMLAKIRDATTYICLQTYIFRPDVVGNQFKNILMQKARNGVRVYFLYDEIGCYFLKDRYLQEMRDAGIQVSAFQTTRGHGNRFQINFRNHRKILIIDGEYGFLGGINYGKEYLGLDPKIGNWRDTHLLIQGPAVQCLQITFAKDWYWATHQFVNLNWQVKKTPNNQPCLILPTGPADHIASASLMLLDLITKAKHKVWIASPYFVPDVSILQALELAVLRGVDVRILLPSRYDRLFVYLCSISFYPELAKSGIQLYRYENCFLHQKVLLIDDELAGVGTLNLDNRSLYINFEITALSTDAQFVAKVAQMLTEDFTKSYRVNLNSYEEHSLWFKILVKFAGLFSPIL
ncbi:MAG: cardiolipin synthase [Legionellales bacterium]|nr:cardiolipin synthase [Legionellales bacterium]